MGLYIVLLTLAEDCTAFPTLVTNMKTARLAPVAAILLLLGLADVALVSLLIVRCETNEDHDT
jgi:hypothetical protein